MKSCESTPKVDAYLAKLLAGTPLILSHREALALRCNARLRAKGKARMRKTADDQYVLWLERYHFVQD